MTWDLLMLLAGLALLTVGGDTVVRGATGLAKALGVSPLVIGLTVVAFGTSAPELAVNVIAAWRGEGDITFGNIIGSNMANIGLIVGCTALIKPIVITGVVIGRELPMMLLATAAVLAMGFDSALSAGGELAPFEDFYTRSDGILLLMFFLVFLYYTVGDFVRQREGGEAPEELEAIESVEDSVKLATVFTLAGLISLMLGASWTVHGAVDLATALGVPNVIIAMTVVAVGTSLPELVASISATMKGHPELAIGNVVGSNIFNVLMVLGITCIVRPVRVPEGGYLDLIVMASFSLFLFISSMSNNRRIIRGEAWVLLVSYLAYMGWRSLSL
jgi:cation:H+ antiporter